MNYYKSDPTTWTKEKQTAVEGYTAGTCAAWDRSFINIIVADYVQGCGIPKEQVYDPVTNPKGARCTMWDTNVATFGRDPKTGFARRSLDNVGVQYGLKALNSNAIAPADFIDLNRKIGGYDNDGKIRAERTAADPEAVRMAYVVGRLDSGSGGLASVPILHYRSYNDPSGDIHSYERDFAVRERLRKANGRVDNQVIWIYPNGGTLGATVSGLAIDTMSQWLNTLTKDTSNTRAIDKVVRAKPAAAVDGCWTAEGTKIEEPLSLTGTGKCATLYPPHSTPRWVAGAPVVDDVLKCQLKPVDAKDYKVTFSAAQVQELKQIFSAGVCDYYAEHAVTIARHPSETDERMMVRLAAFALNAHEHLAFGRGLAEDDEPALWQKDLTGAIAHWIEVGQPDDKTLLRAAGRAERVTVYAYRSGAELWWAPIDEPLARARQLAVWRIPVPASRSLSALAARSMHLQCTIQDGALWISDAARHAQIEPVQIEPVALKVRQA
jgi:uncharacterized protein YaeQ